MAIITISRGTFSGGQSLAEDVAKKLGYRCISREVLVEAARQYDVAEESLRKTLIEKPGFLEHRSLES
ncbi:cytidylate kinase family protein, partial [Chloroflexota bacterium]